ncbi:MAG TPA: hypothetical protein VFJ79_05380, partial [Acidimicrobiales bacterium]|nr:hypothetical protein [Acidimicrobiales bacterium]
MRTADRRRFWRGSGQREVESSRGAQSESVRPGPDEAASARDEDIISLSTLARVPDWARIPPITPALPEMPVVVSRHFDDSLASWQPPERFLAPLAHSLSPDAPSGAVQGLAQLAEPAPTSLTRPAVEPAPAENQAELVLAVPPAADAAHREPVVTSRRIDRFFETPQADAEPPTPHESAVPAVVEAPRPSVDFPESVPSEPVHNPLLHAPAPPDLPLP